MAAGSSSQSSDVLSDINVTPLVDVMLVLLVVMMVTASTVVTRSLSVDLPKGATGSAERSSLTVTLTQAGQTLLDDRPVDSATLRNEIRARRAENSELQALIAADGVVQHQSVVAVLDLLRSERVTRVAVGVTPAGE